VGQRGVEDFYDAPVCAKGVSLGTYLCLHFTEFGWAVRHGVPASLVLVSIELEGAGWFYNVGTWSTCEFEVLFFRSEGEEERRRRERERERESVCV